MTLPQDFKEFLQLLKKHHVEYLVVGGYAVGAHGQPGDTSDIDIWLKISETNAQKLIQVITEFDFGELGIEEQDFLAENNIIQMGVLPLRIDLMTSIEGVVFEQAYPKRDEILVDDFLLDIISYDDLVKNKSATGRLQDQADVEKLKRNKK